MAALNFIRGSVKGKIGQFVGSSWRGKDYIKTYTPPGNPKTAGQVSVRNIFQRVTLIAKSIYYPVLKPYTFPKPQKMTAFNKMVQTNKPMFDGREWDASLLKIFEGALYSPGISGAALSADRRELAVTWDGSQGTADNAAIAVVHSEETGKTLCAVTTRDAGTTGDWDITELGGITDPGKVHAYLVFSRPPAQGTDADVAGTGEVSGTAYHTVTAG
ncbi:MAG: DUF6266 family protein [Treponema sp.]|jgi:hypothetical protein|nr:DUF6266 family protein [Treponema sp.]